MESSAQEDQQQAEFVRLIDLCMVVINIISQKYARVVFKQSTVRGRSDFYCILLFEYFLFHHVLLIIIRS